MKRIVLFLGMCSVLGFSQAQKKPKLVVGIVIDQMKYEYLLRFDQKFGSDGFKLILKDGFSAKNTHYNYIPTYTGPGHAAIYTGTTPRYNGIISNDWYSKKLGRGVYCVGDSIAQNIGGSESNGHISPRNLQVNTITDELKLTTNFRSKVVGLSIKDRGAVLPAGHNPDGAYWFDSGTGEFMSSDYYFKALPAWVNTFNEKKWVDRYLNQTWNTLLPIESYTESTPDLTAYENGFKNQETPTFPYNLEELRKTNGPYGLIRTTPFGNSLLFELGKAAIQGEQLGKDDITDFLAISLSSTDYVGHNFGANAIELEDTYLRLDRDLANFIKHLNKEIGVGEYVLFITADHGVVANPSFLQDHGLPGGYYSPKDIKKQLEEALVEKYGSGEWILSMSNQQVFLNHQLLQERKLNLLEVQQLVAQTALEFDHILEALTATDLRNQDFKDPLRSAIQRGYNSALSGDVAMIVKPGYLNGAYGDQGTSHGTGFTYDTHVPLLFYGQGIKSGSTVRPVSITDIAPTLSFLLQISLPNGAVTGSPIYELFE